MYLEIESAIEANTRPNLPLFIIIIRWLRRSRVGGIGIGIEIFEVILQLNLETGRRGRRRRIGFRFGFGFGFRFGSAGLVGGFVVDFVFGERPERRGRRYWKRTESFLYSNSETVFHRFSFSFAFYPQSKRI